MTINCERDTFVFNSSRRSVEIRHLLQKSVYCTYLCANRVTCMSQLLKCLLMTQSSCPANSTQGLRAQLETGSRFNAHSKTKGRFGASKSVKITPVARIKRGSGFYKSGCKFPNHWERMGDEIVHKRLEIMERGLPEWMWMQSNLTHVFWNRPGTILDISPLCQENNFKIKSGSAFKISCSGKYMRFPCYKCSVTYVFFFKKSQ